MSFIPYVRTQSKPILFYLVCCVIWCIFLHYCYPISDMGNDTGGYIRWAYENKYGGTRPVGYSHFLNFIHQFSTNTLPVFISQLLLFSFANLFFYLSTCWLFKIENIYLRSIFLASCILFISGFYTANAMLSDSIFLSLSLIMLTLCLWFVHKPGALLYVSILIVMLCCMHVRHMGLIYSGVVAIAAVCALKKKVITLVAVAVALVTTLGYTNYVEMQTEQDQGIRIFSGFSGWQKANNALHIVPHSDLTEALVHTDDNEILMVDSIVRQTYPLFKNKYPDENHVSYQFIWSDSLPLRTAMFIRTQQTHLHYDYTWLYMGRLYSEYGDLLIKEHLNAFLRYYLYNNLKLLLHPDGEIFKHFFYSSKVEIYEMRWFLIDSKLKGKELLPAHDLLRPVLQPLPYVYSIFWVIFGLTLIVLVLNLHSVKPVIPLLLVLVGYIIIYACASTYASPVTVRYLMPVRNCIVALTIVCINVYITSKKPSTQT